MLLCKDITNRRKKYFSLFATLLTLTAFAISANAIPPLTTTIAEQIHIPYETFGYIFMLQFVCFALAALVGGCVKGRFALPNRKLVAVGVFSVAVLLIIGNFLSSFVWLVVWVIPLGFAGGLIETFGSIVVAEFEERRSSKLVNLSQAFYCIGAIFAPQLVAILLSYEVSWRVAFLILGTLVFLIGLFFELVNRNSVTPTDVISTPEPESITDRSRILLRRDKLFYLMAFSLSLYVVIEAATVCWIAAYFEKKFNLLACSAAWRLSIFWTGLIAGRLLMLVVPAKWTLWPALIGGALGMLIGNTLLSFDWSSTTTTAIVVLCGIAAGPFWPVTVMVSHDLRNSTRFTSGVIGAGALGAALGPLLGSYIMRYLGLNLFFPILSIGSLLLLSIMLLTKHKATITSTK